MALPASGDITLVQILTEFSVASLTAASTAAGLDPLPTSMTDFYGKSAFTANLQAYTTVGTTNVTVPAGCTAIEFMVLGGGGAGGGIDTGSGANAGYHCGGGGGGGGMYVSSNLAVTAGQTITLVVGAAGSAGTGGDPNLWTHGLDSSLTYGGTSYVGGGGRRGYFAVKAGNTGDGGSSGSPQSYSGGAGVVNRGSGGGGGSGGAGTGAVGSGVTTGFGGNGGTGGTFSITGDSFNGAGGGGGGGTFDGGAAGVPGGGNGFGESAYDFGGGGGGETGETPASFGGRSTGGSGYQGAIVIWYK